jgi:HEAT repeat protein
VRCYAARLLGRLGTTADVPRLDALCQSRYLDVKFAAIAAASRQGDLVRMGLLLDMVDAPEAENRVLAARRLGETAYTPALGRLENLLSRGDLMERTVAAASILRIRASRESWRSRILSDTTAAPAPTATASPAPLPRP